MSKPGLQDDAARSAASPLAAAVADGKPNAQIAAELHLTVPTVKGYISTILAKTATTNRVQLALVVQAAHL